MPETRAMENTLTVINNLQYNPIEIADFCIVEVYKDDISLVNALGYFIQPLDGVGDIKETIANRVRESAPSGYANLVVLAGREFDTFSRRIVYAVWYNGETVPTYPAAPEVHDLGEPGDPFDFYQDIEVINDSVPTDCKITLTIDRLDLPVEFYINDDYFKIDVSKQVPTDEKIIEIDKTGVKYNSVPINTYEFLSIPKLKSAKNLIKVNRLMIRKVKVEFIHKF
jgi:hypothetical protein